MDRGHRVQRRAAPVLHWVVMDVTGNEYVHHGGDNDGEQGFH
jgi:hypothetical protein